MARQKISRGSVSLDDQLSEQLTQLQRDIRALAQQVQSLVRHQGEGSQRMLRNIAENVGERGQMLVQGAQDQILSGYGEIEALVRRNPVRAIVIAAALGLIAGALSRSR